MASTNKTTNYNLSQYIGSDKPTYLGDYNGDMQKIDTQMKLNADSATSANSLATTAKSTADLAEEHAQTGITNAGTADTKATNAQTTATSALAKATSNEALINALMAKFDLSNVETVSGANMTCDNGTIQPSSLIHIAKNSDGSIAKVYGSLFTLYSADGNVNITVPTSLRPEQEFTVVNSAIQAYAITGETIGCSMTFKTNGDIVFTGYASSNTGMKRIVAIPCLLFITDFGDTPSPNA